MRLQSQRLYIEWLLNYLQSTTYNFYIDSNPIKLTLSRKLATTSITSLNIQTIGEFLI